MAALVVACSSKETVPGKPVAGSYTLAFPSVPAAVATDNVQVFVFDGNVATNACATLVQKRKSHADLPAALVTGDVTPVCSVANGSSGSFTVEFGSGQDAKISVLVVAGRQGSDFLIGCQQQDLTASQTAVSVSLTFASSSTSVPTTTCQSLQDHCQQKC